MQFAQVFARHEVARKLPLSFQPERLCEELQKIEEGWWRRHLGPYHDGGWEAVALWAPGGNLFEQTSRGRPFAATPALERSSYFQEVLATFRCEKSRVRLMRLNPGGHIFRHSDPIETISRGLLRVHVPVTTNERVRFTINDGLLAMKPGEVWTVDVRFTHEVVNDGGTPRVHLVIDLLKNQEIEWLLQHSSSIGASYLTGYFLKQSVRRAGRAFSALRHS